MSSRKNTYKETLHLIAEILSFESSNESLRHKLESDSINWDRFVEVSSKQLVLTTCYCRLEQRQMLSSIPKDLALYMQELSSINRNRNHTLISEIKVIIQAFNTNNINYVLLKGAALLMGNYFEDLGERMVGDVDILVSSDDITKAYQLIIDLGYKQSKYFNYEVNNFRHLPRQFTSDKLAVIELHKSTLDKKYKHLIEDNLILNQKVKIQDVSIPNTYFLNLVNIMGLQLNSKGYQYRHWFLRNLYDSLVLQLDKQTALLDNYKNDIYVNDYLSKFQAIFKSLSIDSINKKMSSSTIYYEFKLRNYWYHQLVYKTMFLFYGIYDRITLFLRNSSYRSHLIKNYFSVTK